MHAVDWPSLSSLHMQNVDKVVQLSEHRPALLAGS
jgi:hypothetical protein